MKYFNFDEPQSYHRATTQQEVDLACDYIALRLKTRDIKGIYSEIEKCPLGFYQALQLLTMTKVYSKKLGDLCICLPSLSFYFLINVLSNNKEKSKSLYTRYEKKISEQEYLSWAYSQHINGRFLEGEPTLFKSNDYKDRYLNFLKTLNEK